MSRTLTVASLLLLVLTDVALSQIVVVRDRNTISRPPITRQYRVQNVEVNANIRDQAADVQMAQVFENQSSRTIEAQFLFPLPDGAAISDLTLIVDGKELTGELKKREDARRIYENIVRQQKDPALLEYLGNGVFKTSVFPIPARAKRRVEIRYTQLLKKESGLVDFTLPLGTFKHTQKPIEKTTVRVRINTTEPLKTVYSPSHNFTIKRPEETRARCELELNGVTSPDNVRLMFGTKNGDVGMNLISYRPDDSKPGYFLLLASPKVKAKKKARIPKTVLFVVDKSGSMSGVKIDQAKASLTYMINKLGPKDTFNIVSYSTEVELFREELEVVNDETRKSALAFVDDIYSGGGTNINGALKAALTQLKDRKRPSYVMFMTDGLPTVGVKDEKQIAANAKQANESNARVFNFGVGFDVNSRLLDRLSRDNRGTSIFVKPNEDIEIASTNLFKKVSSPVLTDLAVKITPEAHDDESKAIKRVYPRELTDLFRGEQLVMVGRYKTSGPTRVVMTGEVNGKKKKFELEGDLVAKSSNGSNSYVEKLWATRRIGEIIDQLDLNGRNQELIDELVALSLRHGIMTPYTSFLADENMQLTDRGRIRRGASDRLDSLSIAGGQSGFGQRRFKRALQEGKLPAISQMPGSTFSDNQRGGRGGLGGGGLGNNLSSTDSFSFKRPGTTPTPAKKESVASKSPTERLQRIGSKTFYWKQGVWEDSVLADEKLRAQKAIEIEQYSSEYFELAAKDNSKYSKFLTLKEPVDVVLGGQRYRILPPKQQAKSPAK